ncbi:MAG: DUF4125 family protein [Bilophila sp.]
MPTTSTRQALLDEIIQRELDMFLAVSNRGGVSVCQERPETFRTMRWTSHSVLSDTYLVSYLEDLTLAERENRNFMTEKYALMEDQIPPLSTDPRIDTIVQIESDWRDALIALYPHIVQGHDGEPFRRYLGSELQTLSEHSLALYAQEMQDAKARGENLLAKRYENLFSKMGHASLAAAEASLRPKGT